MNLEKLFFKHNLIIYMRRLQLCSKYHDCAQASNHHLKIEPRTFGSRLQRSFDRVNPCHAKLQRNFNPAIT